MATTVNTIVLRVKADASQFRQQLAGMQQQANAAVTQAQNTMQRIANMQSKAQAAAAISATSSAKILTNAMNLIAIESNNLHSQLTQIHATATTALGKINASRSILQARKASIDLEKTKIHNMFQGNLERDRVDLQRIRNQQLGVQRELASIRTERAAMEHEQRQQLVKGKYFSKRRGILYEEMIGNRATGGQDSLNYRMAHAKLKLRRLEAFDYRTRLSSQAYDPSIYEQREKLLLKNEEAMEGSILAKLANYRAATRTRYMNAATKAKLLDNEIGYQKAIAPFDREMIPIEERDMARRRARRALYHDFNLEAPRRELRDLGIQRTANELAQGSHGVRGYRLDEDLQARAT